MTGLRADTFFKNTTGCFNRYTNWTYNDKQPFLNKMSDSSRDGWTKLNDFTNITKVASNHLWVCNDMAKNFIVYSTKKQEAFGGFTNFLTGFFSNLLAKVISINNIYTSIQNN